MTLSEMVDYTLSGRTYHLCIHLLMLDKSILLVQLKVRAHHLTSGLLHPGVGNNFDEDGCKLKALKAIFGLRLLLIWRSYMGE